MVIKKDVLRAFILMSLFFGLNEAFGQEEDGRISDVKKEFLIATPKNDERTYSVDICDNGVEVILITAPPNERRRGIVLRAVIGWGKGYGKGSACQLEEFLRIREGKTRSSLNKRGYGFFSSIDSSSTHFELAIKGNCFKEGIAQFFESSFNIRSSAEGSDADVDRILDEVLNDENVSLKDLSIFSSEIFLRSKVIIVAYGNIKKEDAEQIRQEAAKIRSKPERVVSAKEIEARRSYFINDVRSLGDCHSVPHGYAIRMTLILYDSTILKMNSVKVITEIVMNKIKDRFLSHIETTYANVDDCQISFEDFRYSNGLGSVELIFYMLQPENNGPFNEGMHEEILEAMFLHLGEAKVSEYDYQKLVKSMKNKFESEAHIHDHWKIMRIISEASIINLPVENYLNYPYEFEGLKSDEINRILQVMPSIENWDIAILGGYSHRLSKEDVSRIKDKVVGKISGNPSTN